MSTVFGLSLRGALSHKYRSATVGIVLLLDSLLVVSSLSLVGSMDEAILHNVTSTIAGDLHVYAVDAPEKLQLFGDSTGSLPDAGVIPDFSEVKLALSSHPNVAAVIPIGLKRGSVFFGNSLDRTLEALRQALRDNRADEVAMRVRRAQQIVSGLDPNAVKVDGMFAAADEQEAALSAIERTRADDFWKDFATDPWRRLEFLENNLAPLAGPSNTLRLGTLGTDPIAFAHQFDRFEIVKGEMIPKGRRGVLINDDLYERVFKNSAVHDFDSLYNDMVQWPVPMTDGVFRERAKALGRSCTELLRDFDLNATPAVEQQLRKHLGRVDGELTALLKEFLTVSRDNLVARYEFFYTVVVPHVELYRVPLGKELSISSLTKRGYATSVSLPVYGTYRFSGLQGGGGQGISTLGDAIARFVFMDMLSFRELQAFGSAVADGEIEALKALHEVSELKRDGIEDVLFQSGEVYDVPEDLGSLAMPNLERVGRLVDEDYSIADLESGPAVSAAVVLKDPKLAKQTLDELSSAAVKANVHIVSARDAAGVVMQYLDLVQTLLYIGLVIVFVVVVLVLNTAIVVATMGRVREMGTLRAIGAQRETVLLVVILEVAMVALVSGVVGATVASWLLNWAAGVGIPANAPIWHWLFGGPRLYPNVAMWQIFTGVISTLVVAFAATIYPLLLAMRVEPVVAMRGAS